MADEENSSSSSDENNDSTTHHIKDSSQSHSSPYYIHPGENPGLVLVSPQLNNNNYHTWSRGMKRALLAKNKLQFINGKLPPLPELDPLFDAWERCNGLVISWITRSLTPSIAQSVAYVENAKVLWEELKERFTKGNHFRFSDLLQEIHSTKQGERSISEIFNFMKTSWEDLEDLRPLPSCTCHTPCNCAAFKIIKQQRDSELVICFLKGLSDNYNTVRSQILLMDPLPSINKVFSLVLQQESSPANIAIPSSKILYNAFDNGNRFQSRGYNNGGRGRGRSSSGVRGPPKQCTFCTRLGHTIDTCYFKHGFPSGYQPKTQSTVNNTTSSNDSSFPTSSNVAANDSSIPQLSAETIQQLLSLLPNSSKSTAASAHNVNTAHTAPLHSSMNHQNTSIEPGTIDPAKDYWILDSGATDHVTHSKKYFTSFRRINPINVSLPDGSIVVANFSGTIEFSPSFKLYNVLYLPTFKLNIVSVHLLIFNSNCKLTFHDSICNIQEATSLKMIGLARLHNGLYYIKDPLPQASSVFHDITVKSIISSFDTWHFRLGHPSNKVLEQVCTVFPYIKYDNKRICDSCHYAKQCNLPFPLSSSVSLHAFDLLHVDIWVPLSIPSLHGHKYFLTIIDDHTRHTWIFLMTAKSETRSLLQNFVIFVKTQFNKSVKSIRSDNGSEFLYQEFYDKFGILHQTSCVATPQQNSIVERKHGQILNVTRNLLFHAKLPKFFWSYAVLHAVYLINRLPSPILQNKSPFELLYNKPPTFLDLKVFGSLCYVSTLEQHRTKLDPRAKKCIFLGFKVGIKGYVVFDLSTREIFVSRNAVFYESTFPYAEITDSSLSIDFVDQDYSIFLFDDPDDSTKYDRSQPHIQPTSIQPISTPSTPSPNLPCDSSSSIVPPPNPHPSFDTTNLRRSTRTTKAPGYLKDFHCNAKLPPSSSTTNSLYPLHSVLSYHKLSPSHLHYTLSITNAIEPQTYKQAIKSQQWIDAMNNELQALTTNNTWSLTTLPKDKVVIGCRWVYRIKHKADGTLERYKARLVAKGYTQQEGVDFLDTFSPVAKLTTIRLLLSIAASEKWIIQQLDVDNAFLHGDLHEEVYMELPPGIIPTSPNQVCRLNKSLYGLRQASRQWFSKLSSALISLGYHHSEYDHSLFIKSSLNTFTALLVYVDDIVLTGNASTEINHVKSFLHSTFRIKDLGNLKYFLGLEVSRTNKGIHLSQRKYALDILADTGMLAAKPFTTPMMKDTKPLYDTTSPPHDPTAFRRLIGRSTFKSIYAKSNRKSLRSCS